MLQMDKVAFREGREGVEPLGHMLSRTSTAQQFMKRRSKNFLAVDFLLPTSTNHSATCACVRYVAGGFQGMLLGLLDAVEENYRDIVQTFRC